MTRSNRLVSAGFATFVAFTVFALAAPLGARGGDVEAWARALVAADDPHKTTRDNVAAWLDRVRAEPDHPLVEATLRLAATDPDAFAAEPALADAALALDGARMSFRARGELARLQGRARAARAAKALTETPSDAFPGWLARFRVLGPLGPLDDLDAARSEGARLAEPGFEREHEGLMKARLRWLTRTRAPLDPTTPRLDLVLGSDQGHALLAFEFASERAAPAWLEIDARDGRGALAFDAASTQATPWRFTLVDPSFDWAFNGEERGRVDFRSGPRSALELAPVRVARGWNRLVISVATDAGATFAVRVLALDGEPLDGLLADGDSAVHEYDGVSAPSGGAPLATSTTAVLRALAERGPWTDALLGVLEVLDGNAPAGVARVEDALARSPQDGALTALCASVLRDAPHLPDAWRRNRARELYAKALELAPQNYRAALELAKRLSAEDKKEDAIARLQALVERAPEREDAWLELERVYDDLGLTVQAERAIERLSSAPRPSWVAFDRAIARLDSAGQATSAYLALVRAVETCGATPMRLGELAGRAAALGRVADADDWHRARIARSPLAEPWFDYARFLAERGRDADADAALARAEDLAPREAQVSRERAELAHRAGAREAERTHLLRVLELEPSDRSTNKRLAALAAHGPLDATADRRRAIEERSRAAYASYDPQSSNDSLVRVLDWSETTVFADGGFEALTHTILHLRDLAACEAQGKQRLSGEVLKVVTHKRDGREIEPIEADGEYVMPALEPGDFVETVNVDWSAPPADGIVRFPRWHFASVDEPFHSSHYELTSPEALGLVVAERHFGELVAVTKSESSGADARGGATHRWTYESHDTPRIVPEPGAPEPKHFLPNVEFGMRPNVEHLAASLAVLGAASARVTPPIAAACENAIAGVAGDEARARALYAAVGAALDRRNPSSFASATAALATRDGNPVWLYSALLTAAGVAHEVVYSRDLDPEADLDAQTEFFDESRWVRRMLVRVAPKDGPIAWCDPSSKTLPYGMLLESAPRAECFATGSRKFIAAPAAALIDRVGERLQVDVRVAADLSAEVELALGFTGNLGYAQKEALRDVPKSQRKRAATRLAAGIVPGFDLESFEFRDVDSDDRPLVFWMKGRVARFVDEANGELSTRLPLPALDLTTGLCGGEGERKLPYQLGSSIVRRAEVRLELAPEIRLVGDGPHAALSFGNGTYDLTTQKGDAPNRWIVRRSLALPPFVIPKREYETLVQFASAVDEAERARLRFER